MIQELANLSVQQKSWTRKQAEAFCKDLAKTHYENFTVGSLFIPGNLRRHMYNVYAFCRWSDDLGDEIGSPEHSLRLLENWETQLEECYQGKATHPIFIALQATIEQFEIPKEPFRQLIQAFKQDQLTTRYADFQELLAYCRHSANPVGRLVLYLFGYHSSDLFALSDKTCTALQLGNFWQDVKRDLKIGRIYIPLEEMRAHQVSEEDLHRNQATPAFQSLLKFQVDRTRRLFLEGEKLVDKVRGLLKIDLEAFTQGGLAVLRQIEKNHYDVLAYRPVVSRSAKLKILLTSLPKLFAR